ncbi:MAG: carboxypeptidase-like regulatory domain-containing protein [Mariprofundales bacterium]
MVTMLMGAWSAQAAAQPATSGSGTITGQITNLSQASTGSIFVAASTTPDMQSVADRYVMLPSATGGTFTIANLPLGQDLYVASFVDVNGDQMPGATEPGGSFGGGAQPTSIVLGDSQPFTANIVIQDVMNGTDPYGMLDPMKSWSRSADFNSDPYVIFSPRIDQNFAGGSVFNPVADGSVDEWTISPFGQGNVTIVLGALDSDFVLDQGGKSKFIAAGTTGSLTVPAASAIKVTVNNQGNSADPTMGSPYHYQLAVIGASQVFVNQDNLSPNADSNDSSTPELGQAGSVTRWYYELPASATGFVQFDWRAKAAYPDGGSFAGGANNDIVASVDLYSIQGGNGWTGTAPFEQHLGNSLGAASYSALLPVGGNNPVWYFVQITAAASGTSGAGNHYTVSATTGTNPAKPLVHRLWADSIDPANYMSGAAGGGATQSASTIVPVLMADFEDSTGAILGSVVADQGWFDPYSLDIYSMPTSTGALDALVVTYDSAGVKMVSLGGSATAPGTGYLIHLRVYGASNGGSVTAGDPILREAQGVLMDLTDTMQDPVNFNTLAAGWYLLSPFGAAPYAGGALVTLQPGVSPGMLMAVDTVDIYANTNDNNPVVIGSAITLDATGTSASIVSTTALQDWYTANSAKLKLHDIPTDNSYSIPGYVFVLQAHSDGNGDGNLDPGSAAMLIGGQELLYLPAVATGTTTGTTVGGVSVPQGWSLHSYNDVLQQEFFVPVAGGESIPMVPASSATGSATGGGASTGTVAPAGVGFGGAPQVTVTLTNPKVVLALLDSNTGTIGVQIPVDQYVTLDSTYSQVTGIGDLSWLPNDSALPGAQLFDPLNPAAGSGYFFKIIAFTDSSGNNGKFDPANGEQGKEMAAHVVYVATDAIAPDGTAVAAGTLATFNPDPQATQPVALLVSTSTLASALGQLNPFVDSFGGVGNAGPQGGGSGASISGKITDTAGNPATNIFVSFEPLDPAGSWGGVGTKSDGSFSIQLNPGDYRVWMDAFGTTLIGGYYDGNGGVGATWDSAPAVTATATNTDIGSIVLGQGTTVAVTVTDQAGITQPNLFVNLEPADPTLGGSFGGSATGTNGIADVGVSDGSYRIWVDTFGTNLIGGYLDNNGGVTADPSQARLVTVVGSNVSVTVALQQGVAITGQIANADGTPAVFAGVAVSDDYGFNGWGNTDQSGNFSVSVNPYGNYRVEVWPASGQGGGFVYATANSSTTTDTPATATIEGSVSDQFDQVTFRPVSDPIVVGGAAVDIYAKLAAGAVVHGTITDSAANKALPNKALPNVWVDFSSLNGAWAGGSTDSNGVFNIQVKPNTDYTMSVWPDLASNLVGGQVQWTNNSYTLVSNWDQATPINAGTAGVTVNVTVAAGKSISGVVKQGGAPVVDAWVNAWSDSAGGGGAPTDQNGNYSINVPAGAGYIVNVWTQDGTNAYYGGAQGTVFDYNKAAQIDTTNASQSGVDFALQQANTISGRVTASGGSPIAWSWVEVRNDATGEVFGNSTDQNGQYKVAVPAASGYKLIVWGQGNYVTTYYNSSGSVTSEQQAELLDASGGSLSNINVILSSGNSIGGTVAGLAAGDTLWLNAWSPSTGSSSGTQVVGVVGGGAVSYTIDGMAPAKDVEVSWWSEKYESGFYGGNDVNGNPITASWDNRKLIDDSNNPTYINIGLATGGTISGTISGLAAGELVDINVWSDTKGGFGWMQVTGGGTQSDAFQVIGLGAASDYRINIMPTDHKGGFVNASNALGSWDNAALFSVSSGADTAIGAVTMTTGLTIDGYVSGLAAGESAWIDAFSESTGAWGGVQITKGVNAAGIYGTSYVIKGLDPANDYRVSVYADGKGNGSYGGASVDGYGSVTTWDGAAKVAAGSSGINMPLSAGKSISGTINGLKSGEWAWVDAFDDGAFAGNGVSITGSGSSSDNFTISGLMTTPTGGKGYRVHISANGYQDDFYSSAGNSTDPDKADLIQLNGDVGGVNFTLSTGNSIRGGVTGLAAGSFGWVDVWSESTGSGGGAPVDAATGLFTVSGLAPAADYYVSLTAGDLWLTNNGAGGSVDFGTATTVDLSAGSASGVNFDLTTVKTFAISGTIAGVASDSYAVTVSATSDRYSGFGAVVRNGNGSYTIKGLPADNYGYVVTASVIGVGDLYYATTGVTPSYDQRTVLVLNSSSGDRTGVDFSFANTTTLTISGTVVNSYGAAVSVYPVLPGSGGNTGSAVTDSKGDFSVNGLIGSTSGIDYYVEVWTVDGSVKQQITLTSNDVAGLTLTIGGTTTYSVSGSVSRITFSGSFPTLVGVLDSSGRYVTSVATDTAGNYTVKGLSSGVTYTFIVDTQPDADFSNDNNKKTLTVNNNISNQPL